MIGELVVRFFVGGALVSAFALLGDLFKPKSFGGLFGAAPSVALATLALTVWSRKPSVPPWADSCSPSRPSCRRR